MKRPQVSIILPVYNAMPFLPEAIASIFSQTLEDWEVIAIDDCSIDGSREYLMAIDDARFRNVYQRANGGVSAAINVGLKLARGKYIARMDADDLCAPTRLERQVQFLERSGRVDLIATGAYVTDKDLKVLIVGRPPVDHSDIVRNAGIDIPLMFGALMGRREWWQQWRMDESIPLAGHEFDLYFRSHRESVFGNVSDPLYVYRFFGHTRSWRKMTTSVYYKARSLVKHGWAVGAPVRAAIGLLSMLPRPLLYGWKVVVGSDTALINRPEGRPSETDQEALDRIVEQVHNTHVPTRAL